MKYLIIGGVAGGATAAARIRRLDEFAEIVIIEKGDYISYANCGLPYYIGGVITEREKLFVQNPISFKKRYNIDVRIESEAISILPESKSVKVRKKDGTVYEETYDKLLLSPGAYPFIPSIEGISSEGIFTLRNVADTDNIKEYITNHTIKDAIVIGGGFIGLEMVENLYNTGADITLIEAADQVMSPLDFSMAAYINHHLLQKGVKLYLSSEVVRFEKSGDRISAFLKDGKCISADIIILSIGVKPETALAVAAGLEIGESGGIKVNEYLQTSSEDIYAVGDAIEYPHPITGKPYLNYLAVPANRQGKLAADNMTQHVKSKYEGAISSAVARVFDLVVATTGLSGKKLKQMKIDYLTSTIHSFSHSTYYPDAEPLTIMITFDPQTGKLYGGQCVGDKGVDKRIDQIALVIKKDGTIYDLIKLEQAYAPPFSTAKDPVAVVGYVADNIMSGRMPIVYWRDIDNVDLTKTVLLDVRTPTEYSTGSISGAINIQLDDLRERLDEIPKDKEIITFCAVGLIGYRALNILKARGYNVKNLSGG